MVSAHKWCHRPCCIMSPGTVCRRRWWRLQWVGPSDFLWICAHIHTFCPNQRWAWWNLCLGGFGKIYRGGTWDGGQERRSWRWILYWWVHTHFWWWLRNTLGCLHSTVGSICAWEGLCLYPETRVWLIRFLSTGWCSGWWIPWGSFFLLVDLTRWVCHTFLGMTKRTRSTIPFFIPILAPTTAASMLYAKLIVPADLSLYLSLYSSTFGTFLL